MYLDICMNERTFYVCVVRFRDLQIQKFRDLEIWKLRPRFNELQWHKCICEHVNIVSTIVASCTIADDTTARNINRKWMQNFSNFSSIHCISIETTMKFLQSSISFPFFFFFVQPYFQRKLNQLYANVQFFCASWPNGIGKQKWGRPSRIKIQKVYSKMQIFGQFKNLYKCIRF